MSTVNNLTKLPPYMMLYQERYLVSPCGHVFDKVKNKFLKIYKQSLGYRQVLIHGKKKYLHTVISECYCTGSPETIETDHLDGDKTNNFFLNLERVTKSQNIKRSFERGDNFTPMARIIQMTEASRLKRRIS